MLNVLLFCVVFLSFFHVLRILRGPRFWSRLLGLNLFSMHIVLAILIYAVKEEHYYLIDLAFVYVLLGFIGILFISGFMKRGGKL